MRRLQLPRPRRLVPDPPELRRVVEAHDLLTVQTIAMRTLLVFISHDRRRIVHVNVTRQSTAGWIWRHLIAATPWGTAPRFLIRDRDRSYGADFVARTSALGIRTVLTPVRAPNARAP